VNGNLEAYDWAHMGDRRDFGAFGPREGHERHFQGREAERDLEVPKSSLSSVVSAWVFYILMVAGVSLFSALYSSNVDDLEPLTLSDTQ
jgi:hypothetical protein